MSQFDRYYQQGLLLLKQGNNRGAIAALTEAIKLEPNYANTYSFRGEAHSELGNYTEALADFSKAIALSPQEAYLYCLRGWTKEELSDYQGAILDFDRAIALNYHDANIHISRGYAHRVLGNLQNAIAEYTKAIAIDSENWNGYSHRGYARQAAGDISGAIEDFTKVVRLNPNDANAKKQLSSLIEPESVQLQGKSGLWVGGIGTKLKNVFGKNNQDRKLNLIYRPKYADEETISDPSIADLERVIDELWQEAQYIIQEEVSRFTGHFILEDCETKDYIQGMWDTRFYPAGGFHLEWSCNGNRSWLPLPQTDSEAKEILRLWLEDIQACSALNWEIIGDSDPMSLEHPSRRGFKIIHLLKQYEAGERNFRRENLSNANLFEADLQGINLSHACLVGADLRGANLIRANLAEADLRDSCLIEADLRGANLQGTKFEGAIYDEDTEFPDDFDPEAAEMEFYAYEEEEDDDDESISDLANSCYLETGEEIRAFITHIKAFETLWLDTEIADWNTQHPRLSLIQVLADPQDLTGESTYILDVLDKPEIVSEFINQIMANASIEKVFHNASFDLRYLGGKERAKNITCTYKIAQQISKKVLGTSNLKLKTLAVELCNFPQAEIANEQGSDWRTRPLSREQIKYAKMDTVYLARVHHRLLEFKPHMPLPQPNSFSVTDVRVAFECPRLFYLNKHFGGKTLFTPTSSSLGIGNTFHKLANEFITTVKQEPQFKDLFEPSAKQLKLEAVASQMQDIFYSVVFFPNYLQPTIQTKPDLAPALNQIWQGLRNLIQQWTQLLIKNRAYSNADEIFDRTFVSTESKLEFDFNLPDGTQQSIVGRLDCLIYDYSKGRPCVVELKTYAPVDPSAQLAQVALYSYMIQQLKKVPVDSAVYCVLPEFKEYHYAWSELETNLHQVIPFKLQQMQQWLEWQPSQPDAPPPTSNSALCSICPQQKKCQSFFTDEPPQLPDDPPIEPETIGRELVETLKSFKVNVEYIGAIAGPTFTRIKLKPGKGVKVASILKLASDLQVQLGIVRPPLISTQPGYVSVDLPREDRQIAYFKDYIQPQKKSDRAAVTIAIGVDLEGKLVEADLADSNNCHFLIGGTPGSGKSEFLRSLLLSLIYRHSPEQVKIALVDPKRVTFPEFTQMPWLLSPVVKDSEAAISLMEELVREMDKRYKIFETAGCPHLDAYNQKQTSSKHNLPRIVCIFDEYADFMVEKETRNALETSIKRLGGMARAAGIHLIIATQRPEASVVTPIIRDNLPGRIALSTSGSEANSKIILGGTQTEGAYLLGKGDLLYQVGAQLQRLQSLFADLVRLPSYQEQINFIPDRQNNL
ncbi:MAG: DNA translocase FtsK [Xenococcaceae cyanobacterium MO_207.B15]|nr:DNA translocase FtsK [Xenococcaceae cyanobacterium MO_207.B15]